MVHMVMSSLPVNRNKKKTTRNENILKINYEYLGPPIKKGHFFVKQRLMYRSSVEVTLCEVFQYLSKICGHDGISLKYSYNDQLIYIMTTGQLHTFLENVTANPNMKLYIEDINTIGCIQCQSEIHHECLEYDIDSIDDEEYESVDDIEYSSNYKLSGEYIKIQNIEVPTELAINFKLCSVFEKTETCKKLSELRDHFNSFCESYKKSEVNNFAKTYAKKLIDALCPEQSHWKHEAFNEFKNKAVSVYEKRARKAVSEFVKTYNKNYSFAVFYTEISKDYAHIGEYQAVVTSLCHDYVLHKCYEKVFRTLKHYPFTILYRRVYVMAHQFVYDINNLRLFCWPVSFDGCNCSHIISKCYYIAHLVEHSVRFYNKLNEEKFGYDYWESIMDYLNECFELLFNNECDKHIIVHLKFTGEFCQDKNSNLVDSSERFKSEILSMLDFMNKTSQIVDLDKEENVKKVMEILNKIIKGNNNPKDKVCTKCFRRDRIEDEEMCIVCKMIIESIDGHKLVYPEKEKSRVIKIPTGSVAKCRCSPNCHHLLNEPDYIIYEKINEKTYRKVQRK